VSFVDFVTLRVDAVSVVTRGHSPEGCRGEPSADSDAGMTRVRLRGLSLRVIRQKNAFVSFVDFVILRADAVGVVTREHLPEGCRG
jgi:hypothetical protein